jgi:hypothetical protein
MPSTTHDSRPAAAPTTPPDPAAARLADLAARLARLEGQNRRFRRALALMAVVAGAGLLLAAVDDDNLRGRTIRPSSVYTNLIDADRGEIDELRSDRIEAREIRVDRLAVTGMRLGELRVGGAGRHTMLSRQGIVLVDRSGAERLRLTIPEDVDSPLLEVLGEDGETRQIALGCWDEAGDGYCGLSILDDAGEAVFEVALPAEVVSDYQPEDGTSSDHARRIIIRR